MLLEAENIHKKYPIAGGSLEILKGIDFRIKEGEVVSVIGPSGAGKSTLLHILGGLDVPDQGRVLLQGEDLYREPEPQRAKTRNRKIGFVFQFYHLLPEFTALENVILPAVVKAGRERAASFKTAGMDLLTQVGLQDRAEHKPSQLSGGEQQRVAIARALINHPQIIFCDEPTGNLDSESGSEIIRLLMRLNKQDNQTILIVTHDPQIAKQSHRVIKMVDGVIQPV